MPSVDHVDLKGLILIEPAVFTDNRGYFLETWNAARYRDFGVESAMVQDNLSFSHFGVLRGLHFQNPSPQGKLISVLVGQIFDVAVDIRLGSPTFGSWNGVRLSADDHRQFFIPPGFAHGFCVLSPSALVNYKCTEFYQPKHELSLAWNDPDLAIDWPLATPIVSPKDAAAPRLAEIPRDRLPRF